MAPNGSSSTRCAGAAGVPAPSCAFVEGPVSTSVKSPNSSSSVVSISPTGSSPAGFGWSDTVLPSNDGANVGSKDCSGEVSGSGCTGTTAPIPDPGAAEVLATAPKGSSKSIEVAPTDCAAL